MDEKINFRPTADDWLTNIPKRWTHLTVRPMSGKFMNFAEQGKSVRFTLDGRKKGESYWVLVPTEYVEFEGEDYQSDDELPGMWEHAHFMGGNDD